MKACIPASSIFCLIVFQIDDKGTTLGDVVDYTEIFPSDKKQHFRNMQEKSGVDFSDMIFFDNEIRNCRSVERLGVLCVHTPRGLTKSKWEFGLKKFKQLKRWWFLCTFVDKLETSSCLYTFLCADVRIFLKDLKILIKKRWLRVWNSMHLKKKEKANGFFYENKNANRTVIDYIFPTGPLWRRLKNRLALVERSEFVPTHSRVFQWKVILQRETPQLSLTIF